MPYFVGSTASKGMFEDTKCVAKCPTVNDTTLFPSSAVPYSSEQCILCLITFLDFERYCLPNDEGAKTFFKSASNDKLGEYIMDLYIAWKVFLIAIAISFVLALVYMMVIRCCGKLIVWVTFIAFVILLAVIGYFFYDKAVNAVDDGDELNYKVLAIMFWCIDGVLVIVLFCLFDEIQLALTIIQVAGQFVFSSFFILLVPIVAIVATACYLAYWIATVVYIYSIGDITQYNNTPFSSVDWDETTRNLWYYHLVALVWVTVFFLAIVQFVIAATAAQWYFSWGTDQSGSGSICKSLYWVFRYHLGSLAFGSLILTIVIIVRFIFEYMKAR